MRSAPGDEYALCYLRSVAPDDDHVEVTVEHKRIRDRDNVDEYFLHNRCALNVMGGWEKP